MANSGARYEYKSIWAIRGTEARTVAKWQQDGWELDGQDQGTLRTELTFRRVKPKVPSPAVLASGGVLLLFVILGIIAGILESGGSSKPAASSPPSAAQAADAPSKKPSTAPAKATQAPASPEASQGPRFGQTVPFTVSGVCDDEGECGAATLQLQVTVSGPTAFNPDYPAHPTQATSVYFTVTIKNVGAVSYDTSEVPTGASSGGTDGDIAYSDADGVLSIDGLHHIRPGESYTFKDGFNVASADDVTYNIAPYGLGGKTLYFTK